jgi:hypothetical protein
MVRLSWHIAALSRVERLPELAEMLAPAQTEEQIEAGREENDRDLQEMIAARERAKAGVKLDG